MMKVWENLKKNIFSLFFLLLSTGCSCFQGIILGLMRVFFLPVNTKPRGKYVNLAYNFAFTSMESFSLSKNWEILDKRASRRRHKICIFLLCWNNVWTFIRSGQCVCFCEHYVLVVQATDEWLTSQSRPKMYTYMFSLRLNNVWIYIKIYQFVCFCEHCVRIFIDNWQLIDKTFRFS